MGAVAIRLFFGFAVALAVPFGALAQSQAGLPQQTSESAAETATFDAAALSALAERAVAALDDPSTPIALLESIREDLFAARAQLQSLEDVNADRIKRLRDQLDALGPAPDPNTGATEPEDIAARRAQLQEELAKATAPQLAATEAYQRADGLIAEINARIRERNSEELRTRSPSPLNPANWGTAARELLNFEKAVVREVTGPFALPWKRSELVRDAPLTLGLTGLALLLLVWGRFWLRRYWQGLRAQRRRPGTITLAFVLSLGQVLLPVAGVLVLAAALMSTNLVGARGEAILQGILILAASGYTALWLGDWLLPRRDAFPAIFDAPPEERARARKVIVFIGIMVGLSYQLRLLREFIEIGNITIAVVSLPIYLGLAYGYYLLYRLIRRCRNAVPEGETPSFMLSTGNGVGRILLAIAVLGPLATAIGYVNLADAILLPAAWTLGLLGVLLVLQWPIKDLYGWAAGVEFDKAGEALVPVLVNFLLALGSLPILALIWGTSPAELAEYWQRLNKGLPLGEVQITPAAVFSVILVFAIGMAMTRLLQGALRSSVLPRTRLDSAGQTAVVSVVGYIGIGLSLIVAVNVAGIDLTALAVVAGALSVGIGFGLQNIVQNFISGIILLVERPIGKGDWIEVGGNMGIVQDISVRSTTIETFDKQQVIVPNADFISGTVTNWTRGSQIGRAVVTVGVAYGTDTRRVQAILEDVVRDVEYVARFPKPGVDFMGFGADSLDFRIRAILTDVNQVVGVRTEIHHRIAERFAEEGIEIPFAQRDIWFRNPEALTGAGASASGPPPAAGGQADEADGQGTT